MRVHVDYDRCTGLGVCESFAPDVFTVEDDGHMHMIGDRPADSLRDVLADAVASCPTHALTISD